MTRVLFFIGAGASVPFGNPTMKQMVARFENLLKGPSDDTPPSANNATMLELYSRIKRSLETTYGYADLESVFSVIEILSRNITYQEFGSQANYIFQKLGVSDTRDRISNDVESKTAGLLLDKFRSFVREECSMKENMMEKIDVNYRDLFNAVASKDANSQQTTSGHRYSPWPIYTTNYDRILEEYWTDVANINDLTRVDSGKNILDFSKLGESDKIRLVKLHGSLDWYKLEDGSIARLETRRERYGRTKVEGELMLYPIQQKDLYLHPWIDMFHRLKRDLNESTNWIIIGYSFNDPFILDIFKEARKKGKHRIIIVEPHLNELVTEKFGGWYEDIKGIMQEFGHSPIGDRVAELMIR